MTDKHAVELAARLKANWNPHNNSRPPTAEQIKTANREGRLRTNGFDNILEIESNNPNERFSMSEKGDR